MSSATRSSDAGRSLTPRTKETRGSQLRRSPLLFSILYAVRSFGYRRARTNVQLLNRRIFRHCLSKSPVFVIFGSILPKKVTLEPRGAAEREFDAKNASAGLKALVEMLLHRSLDRGDRFGMCEFGGSQKCDFRDFWTHRKRRSPGMLLVAYRVWRVKNLKTGNLHPQKKVGKNIEQNQKHAG